MKHLFTTTLLAALALPFAAAGQERYPTLKPDQLSAAQEAYVENLAKPPRNNTLDHVGCPPCGARKNEGGRDHPVQLRDRDQAQTRGSAPSRKSAPTSKGR